MKNKIAVLIPTRERISDFIIFADSWVNTTNGLSDVIIRIDNDDTTYEEIKHKYPQFIYEYGERKPFLELLNELAVKYSDDYKYIGFMEDDCNFVTPHWEQSFISRLELIGKYGIVWGNDLINNDRLVGLPFMTSSIVKTLGYMCPPEIKYLFADVFWKDLGNELCILSYMPEVVVEHRHYSTGKRQIDVISQIVDSNNNTDDSQYQLYKSTNFINDIQKIKNTI